VLSSAAIGGDPAILELILDKNPALVNKADKVVVAHENHCMFCFKGD
jgi:hypothetical protein